MCQPLPGAESTPHPTTNQVICRVCGQAIPIKPWWFNGKDISIVTCENPTCTLYTYTFTASTYAVFDLSEYLSPGGEGFCSSPTLPEGEGAGG